MPSIVHSWLANVVGHGKENGEGSHFFQEKCEMFCCWATMQCIDVLYGVTRQETGISRRMSIRFEDWKEEEPQPAA
jgi:hypothetical protein